MNKELYVCDYNDGVMRVYDDLDKLRLDMLKFYANHFENWYIKSDRDRSAILNDINEDLIAMIQGIPNIPDCVYVYHTEDCTNG